MVSSYDALAFAISACHLMHCVPFIPLNRWLFLVSVCSGHYSPPFSLNLLKVYRGDTNKNTCYVKKSYRHTNHSEALRLNGKVVMTHKGWERKKRGPVLPQIFTAWCIFKWNKPSFLSICGTFSYHWEMKNETESKRSNNKTFHKLNSWRSNKALFPLNTGFAE